jgi:hypothetical protein
LPGADGGAGPVATGLIRFPVCTICPCVAPSDTQCAKGFGGVHGDDALAGLVAHVRIVKDVTGICVLSEIFRRKIESYPELFVKIPIPADPATAPFPSRPLFL